MDSSNSQRVQLRKCAGRYMEMVKWYINGTLNAFYQNPLKPQTHQTFTKILKLTNKMLEHLVN